MAPRPRAKSTIGWREWVSLPDLGGVTVKAKIDTGARTSSLHAPRLTVSGPPGDQTVRFLLHPEQRSSANSVWVEAPVLEQRDVRSSNGQVQTRPTIRTRIRLGEVETVVDLTLADRGRMGFRMLLGRTALRRNFLIDPGRSELMGRPTPSTTQDHA